AAGVDILVLPARVVLVGIEAPAQHEMRAAPVAVLFCAQRPPDQVGKLAVRLVAALVRGLDVHGVRLHARQGRAPLPLRGLARTPLQLGTTHLRVDLWHRQVPSALVASHDPFSAVSASSNASNDFHSRSSSAKRTPYTL